MSKKLCVALVAGEASGDLLGADLMRALKLAHPAIHFIGIGGARMRAEGLSSFFAMERLSVMGLIEVLGRLPELLLRRWWLLRRVRSAQPDVFIGIDAPDFNLWLERRLRQAGIPIVHYVSPSVWAWRAGRVLKIRAACDLMLTLFPFEARFYQEHRVPVRFVGHPLADTIPVQPDRVSARQSLGVMPEQILIALLPGSRAGEVQRLAPLFLAAARQLHQENPLYSFVLPCATPERRIQLELLLAEHALPIVLLDGHSSVALSACDIALIASGTATLEAMLYQCPMVVAYRVADWTYRLLRPIVRARFFALPNLLADRLLVPECIQSEATVERLVVEIKQVLRNKNIQIQAFAEIGKTLRLDASTQAAAAVLDVVRS